MRTEDATQEMQGLIGRVFEQHCQCCERLADELIASDVIKRKPDTSPFLHRTMMIQAIHEVMELKSFFLTPGNYEYTKKVVMRNLTAAEG